MMLSSFVFLIYFVCINVSFIVIQYIHADKSEHTLDPGASGPADMKTDGLKETDLSQIPGEWQMSLYQLINWETGAGPMRADSVFGGGCLPWDSYLHPVRWRPSSAVAPRRSPQNVMGAFVVRLRPPHSITTHASKCLLVVVFFLFVCL